MSDSIHLHRASLAGDENSLQKLLVRHLADLRAFVRLRMSPLLRQKESCSDLVQVCFELFCRVDGTKSGKTNTVLRQALPVGKHAGRARISWLN